jgi:cell division protein FtsI (penicillin-binding protein 3)
VQGVYELGSVFKAFTVAQGLELGLFHPGDMIDTRGPLRMAGFNISDYRSYGPSQSVHDVFIHSSNIGTARMAQVIGAERQRAFLERLGLLEAAPVEVIEAANARPLLPPRWGDLATMTISYGHGVSTSPVSLAAAYASLVNGGTLVRPTLLRQDAPQQGERVVSEETSAALRAMMRATVTEGTASFGEVAGYAVGGKTGTADMPRPTGGYYEDRNLVTFAAAFPMHDPRYVLITTCRRRSRPRGRSRAARRAGPPFRSPPRSSAAPPP